MVVFFLLLGRFYSEPKTKYFAPFKKNIRSDYSNPLKITLDTVVFYYKIQFVRAINSNVNTLKIRVYKKCKEKPIFEKRHNAATGAFIRIRWAPTWAPGLPA